MMFLYFYSFCNFNILITLFRSTQPLQELVNRGTEFLTIGREQFRQGIKIRRALVEREKRQFYTYWCKAQAYLREVREEMTRHKILLDVISETSDCLLKQTRVDPLPDLYIIQEEIRKQTVLEEKILQLRKREQR